MAEDKIKKKVWILHLEHKSIKEIVGVYKSEEGARKAKQRIQSVLAEENVLYFLPLFIIEYDLLP